MKLQKFDYQIKDNKKNKSLIVVSILLVALVVGVVLYKSFAAYKVTESYNIIKGSVAEFTNDPLMISYNLVGEDGGIMTTNEIPSNTEYEYDAIKSKCENGNTITYDKENNTIIIGDNTEGLEDTCNIYFNYIPLSTQTLYALGYTLDDVHEGSPYDSSNEGVNGLYAAPDNYGTSYYFYGESEYPPTFSFAEQMWLFIRINGDGSIRMMGDISVGTVYNTSADDNAYLGFSYGEIGASNILDTQANNISSKIQNNLKEEVYVPILESYSSMLGDAYFCNDRSVYKEEYGEKEADDTTLGTGNNTTYYGAYYRLRNNTPSLKCNKNDAFTINESENGNGAALAKIGLISADEEYMTRVSQWLGWTGTMTPAYFKENIGYYYTMNYSEPTISSITTSSSYYPVINLRHGLTYTGDPSWFEVSE